MAAGNCDAPYETFPQASNFGATLMGWGAQVFQYCERGADPSFWAEPLNALTNVCFLLAAVAAALRLRARGGRVTSYAAMLIALVGLIGFGSFLFHVLATRWAQLGDVVPIGLFMLSYLGFALRHLMTLSRPKCGAALLAFVAALWLAGSLRCGGGQPCLNGSLGYVPALVALLSVAALLRDQAPAAARALAVAGGIFAVSLTLRSLDISLCAATLLGTGPLGVHFLWHVLNAAMLYLLLRVAVDQSTADPRPAPG